MDEIDIWHWKADYFEPSTLGADVVIDDGQEAWGATITCPDRAVSTHGSNQYPDNADPTRSSFSHTKRFHRLISAIEKLGGPSVFLGWHED
jgi:hypothetical protein